MVSTLSASMDRVDTMDWMDPARLSLGVRPDTTYRGGASVGRQKRYLSSVCRVGMPSQAVSFF